MTAVPQIRNKADDTRADNREAIYYESICLWRDDSPRNSRNYSRNSGEILLNIPVVETRKIDSLKPVLFLNPEYFKLKIQLVNRCLNVGMENACRINEGVFCQIYIYRPEDTFTSKLPISVKDFCVRNNLLNPLRKYHTIIQEIFSGIINIEFSLVEDHEEGMSYIVVDLHLNNDYDSIEEEYDLFL